MKNIQLFSHKKEDNLIRWLNVVKNVYTWLFFEKI